MVQASVSLSQRLWGLDWRAHLPFVVDEFTVECVGFDEALPFIETHYAAIFGEQQARFLGDPFTGAKRRFCDEMDVLAFRTSGETVGLLIGHPQDWSTYYMRSVAVLPAYRRRHLLTRVVQWTEGPLRAAGVERIEGDCSPANVAMTRMLSGLGYITTGTTNSERWGTMLRLSRFLRDEAEEVFARQFCGTRVKPVVPGWGTSDPSLERRTA